MSKLKKFENVDIITSLEMIMKQNTAFYQSDFDIDKQIITEKALSSKKEDKTLLWLSRPSGTNCLRERDVFIDGTTAHSIWCYYYEQDNENILAYAVELTEVINEKIFGNIYELDFADHYKRVKNNAVTSKTEILYYEHGSLEQPVNQHINDPDPHLGKLDHLELLPVDPEALQLLLWKEKEIRTKLKTGDFGKYIAALQKK